MDFLIVSNSKENKIFAKKYNVWQTKNVFHSIKVGDFAFIKVSGTNEIEFIGVCESVGQEPVLRWPESSYDQEASQETQFTIRFRSTNNSDFKAGQNAIRYRK